MNGYLARSLAGHDKGKIYAVISEDKSVMLLADGRERTLGKPKKKNPKHVQIIKIAVPIDNNEVIKHSIKMYRKSLSEE